MNTRSRNGSRSHASIKVKLFAIILGLIALQVVFSTTYFPARHIASLQRGLERKAAAYGLLVARQVEPAIAFDDRETAREIFDAVATDVDVRGMALYSDDGTALYTRGELVAAHAAAAGVGAGSLETLPGRLRYSVPVVAKEGPRGALVIELSTESIDAERSSLQRTARLAGIVALAIGASLAWLIARSLAGRLRRIADVTMRVAAGDLEQPPMDDRSADEVGELARCSNEMVQRLRALMDQIAAQAAEEKKRLDELVARRTKELDRRNDDMRLVLRHVGEGFLIVDRRGMISEERSAILDTWLGAAGPDTTLWDYVGRTDPAAAAWCETAWTEVLEDALPIELTLSQMPKAIATPTAQLRVRYTPIFAHGALERVLVVISDATSDLERERAEAAQRETLTIFRRITRDKEGFLEFFEEAGGLVRAISGGHVADQTVTLRSLHTLKGNALFFGLTSIAELCHEMESAVFETREPPNASERAALGAAWQRIADTLRALTGSARKQVEIEPIELESLRHAALAGVPPAELAAMIEAFSLEPTERRLARIADQARALAHKLGKPGLRVIQEHNGVRLDPALWAPFWSAIVHAIRNAVDHGIESPSERTTARKAAHGTISLRTLRDGSDVVIEVGDDGRGMRWDVIADAARAAGLPNTTRANLQEALFMGGVSTGASITEVSGRGIGLEALRAASVALGGKLDLASEAGVGTTIRFRIPSGAPRRRSPSAPPATRSTTFGPTILSTPGV